MNCQEKALDFPNMIEKRQNESVLAKKTFEFFENDRFFENWDKLVKTANSNTVKIAVSFHCKLDGLKIIRLIHYLEK